MPVPARGRGAMSAASAFKDPWVNGAQGAVRAQHAQAGSGTACRLQSAARCTATTAQHSRLALPWSTSQAAQHLVACWGLGPGRPPSGPSVSSSLLICSDQRRCRRSTQGKLDVPYTRAAGSCLHNRSMPAEGLHEQAGLLHCTGPLPESAPYSWLCVWCAPQARCFA